MHKKIADVSKAAGKRTYKGKTYYLCCQYCVKEWDKNPAKYADK
jgi:YHS domain-containing protein